MSLIYTRMFTFFTIKFELKQAGLLECGNIKGFYQQKQGLYYIIQYQYIPEFSDGYQYAAKWAGLCVIS